MNTKGRVLTLVLWMAVSGFLISVDVQASADHIFHGGAIYTVNPQQPWAEAVVIDDDEIVFVGDLARALTFRGEGTQLTELGERMLLPGFQDSHLHLLWGGNNVLGCDLFDVETDGLDMSVDQLRDKLKSCDQEIAAQPDKWLQVSSWSRTVFDNGIPPAGFLDELFPKRPVAVSTTDAWSLWVNQVALDRAGITRDTLNPVGGVIDKHPVTGEPTGLLAATAMDLVYEVIPPFSREENLLSIREAVKIAHAHGITSAIEPGLTRETAALFSELDRQGHLDMRILLALSPMGWSTAAFEESDMAYWKNLSDLESRYVKADSVKMFVDGVIENETAPLLEPYLDGHGHAARPYYESADLDRFFRYFDQAGISIHVHAIGDLSIRQGLDSFERMRKENGKTDNRHTMTHLQIIHPQDLSRFSKQDITASMSLFWAWPEGYNTELYPDLIGPERVQKSYPAASLQANGARIAGASDWAVSTLDPLLAIEAGITRQDPEGSSKATLNAAEGLDLASMIKAYTRNVAWLMKNEHKTGVIAKGMQADLVILDRNLFELPVREISEARVVQTWFAGKRVYSSNH